MFGSHHRTFPVKSTELGVSGGYCAIRLPPSMRWVLPEDAMAFAVRDGGEPVAHTDPGETMDTRTIAVIALIVAVVVLFLIL